MTTRREFLTRTTASDRSVAASRMVDKLKEAKAAGVDTVIDLTTYQRAIHAITVDNPKRFFGRR